MDYNFEKLKVWQEARSLAIIVYKTTSGFPKHEIFALTSQINRAVVSISANIAEGSSRSSHKDMCHFLEIALGSAFELKTLIDIAFSQDYLPSKTKAEIDNQLKKAIMLIYGLKRSLK